MDVNEQLQYWQESATHDLKTAESMLASGHYDWCLFVGHLALEKILKALYVKVKRESPPKIHLLHILAKETALETTPDQMRWLRKINDFNMEARYPQVKFDFYKVATKEFALEYLEKIKEMYQWISQKI